MQAIFLLGQRHAKEGGCSCLCKGWKAWRCGVLNTKFFTFWFYCCKYPFLKELSKENTYIYLFPNLVENDSRLRRQNNVEVLDAWGSLTDKLCQKSLSDEAESELWNSRKMSESQSGPLWDGVSEMLGQILGHSLAISHWAPNMALLPA